MKKHLFIAGIFLIVWFLPQPCPASTARPLVQTGHTGYIECVAFSPDGRYAISGGHEKTLYLWEVKTGRLSWVLKGHTNLVKSVTFSPDGKHVLSGSWDRTLRLWEMVTGKQERIFRGHTRGINSVAFSPDGKYTLSGSKDTTLRLWEILTGRQVKVFKGHTQSVNSVVFSPDGRYALSGSQDDTVRLWEVASGKQLRVFKGHKASVESVAFSPDGRYAVSGSRDKTVRLWEVKSARQLRLLKAHGEWVWSVTFSPNGKYLLSGGLEGISVGGFLRLWAIETGRQLRVFRRHHAVVSSVAFSPDGSYVLSGSYDKTLRLWDVATGKKIRLFKGNKGSVRSVAFSPNGRHTLLCRANDAALYLWDIHSGRRERVFKGHTSSVRSVAFSPEGRYALSGSGREVCLWNVATGRRVRVFKEGANEVSFSPDGKYVLSHGTDYAFLWDIASGRKARLFNGHPSRITSIAFSPDGRYVLSGGSDNIVRLWEVDTGKELRALKGHTSEIETVTFSPDGNHAISGGMDGTLRLWEMATGRQVHVFKGHFQVYSAAFSPDGEYALSAGWDNTLRLWDVADGNQIRVFKGHTNFVRTVSFSPDGKYALSGSDDTSMRLWSVASGKELASFYDFKDGEWIVISPEGYFNASSEGAKHVNVQMGPLEVYSIDQFFEQFFNPTLVAQVLEGRKVEFKRDIAKEILPPPEVQIISPKPGQIFKRDTIQVEVVARETGGGIDEIRLFHNGKVIGEKQRGIQVVPTKSEVKKIYRVTLLQGENRLHAVAFNHDRTESNPHELVVFLKAVSKETALNLLVVGINNYKNPALKLNYAIPDAKGIVRIFNERGRRLFRKVSVMSLYDDQATGVSIRSRLKRLGNTQPQDTVVIFLAGHGENLKGKWYFIPYEVIYPERDQEVMIKGISSDDIADYVRHMGARKILLLMDSCKAGAALLAFRGYEDRRVLMQLARATGVHIVAASTKDQYAAEVKAIGHGVFTYTLLSGIKGEAAAGGQKTITVRRLLAFVEERLPEVSKKYKQDAQYPVVYSRGMDFPLSVK